MASMVSHRSSIYMDAAEVVDAAILAHSMVPSDHVEYRTWMGVFACLNAINNYNSNTAEEFVANVAQEIDHLGGL